MKRLWENIVFNLVLLVLTFLIPVPVISANETPVSTENRLDIDNIDLGGSST